MVLLLGLDGTPSRAREAIAREVVSRLARELGPAADVDEIGRVVLTCRSDLSASPVGALPELLERLARQRLLDLADARTG